MLYDERRPPRAVELYVIQPAMQRGNADSVRISPRRLSRI